MKINKPILSVRPSEGAESLIRRAKFKLVLDKRGSFEKMIAESVDINNRAQVLDALERFFELEYK